MKKNLYTISSKESLEKMESSVEGISKNEFIRRAEKYGKNKLPQKDSNSSFKIFLSQFASPLAAVILVVTIFSFMIGHFADAFFIVFVILVNSIVGFIQENKAEKVLQKISESVKFYCKVIRDGRKKEVPSEEIVVGDVVELAEGDKVPADGRIIEAKGLKINEAVLTGEWMSVDKEDKILKRGVALAEKINMAFMGSVVEEGRGRFVVSATGMDTELGKISQLVKEESSPKTPLQKRFFKLSKIMAFFVVLIVGLFSLVYIARGEEPYQVFITAIALVVSAVPEGLLPAITIALVFAMRRLIRKKALVRRLNATEGMGSVSTICMDKTGTLTKGEMQVSHILTGDHELLREKDEFNDIYTSGIVGAHLRVLETITLVNDAYVENPEENLSDWVIRGRHTDKALLIAGIHSGIEKEKLESEFEVIKKIPFRSEEKYAAQVYKTKENKALILFMGAPEVVLKRCKNITIKNGEVALDSDKGRKLIEKVEELTSQGLRLVACASREVDIETYEKKGIEELSKELDLAGFVALKDPVRKDVKKSIETTKRAGIRAIVITGDHRNTAKAIVNELGMNVEDREIKEGVDLDLIKDSELVNIVKKTRIFARVSPKHKIRIVKALQESGEVVAMVGDGINDAPALKSSDIGISVGTGTDIAKDVADIILLNNSFSVIVKAIEQGRIARENIRRIVIYLMADDFSELFLFFFALIIGLPFPLYPIQILWINIVEDSFPNIALTSENNAKGIMDEKPIPANESILSKPYKKFMGAVFIVTSLAASSLFYFTYKITGDIEKTRTLVFALVAFDSLVFAYIVKSFRQTLFNKDVFSNKLLNWAIVGSLTMLVVGVYVPFFQKIINTTPMNLMDWVMIVGISILEIIILEIFKYKFFIKKMKDKA
jgi:Ca2+-transporting ATPase